MNALRTALIIAIAAGLGACSQPELRSYSGRAQGEYVRVAVPLSGSLAKLNVRRGETVREGEPLFSLDNRDEQAAQRETMERIKAAQARLRTAQRNALPDEIRAAQTDVDASQAELARLQWRLDQSVARAPSDGVIVDTAYSEGQWVEAGIGIVSLLSPQNLKVQFYVPAQAASTLHHGQSVRLRCGGCEEITGRIVYVSPIAEAPDDGSMARLRFLVEARPAPSVALRLRPGQAVEVML